jgi:SAM-dependent methyltransferase
MSWVAEKVAVLSLADGETLELGSRWVNGSVRGFFTGSYLGVDHEPQEGAVDLVADAMDLPLESESFDVVVSTEMLEHCERPADAVREMGRVCRTNGYVLVTARGPGFPYHDPPDHWRFQEEHMIAMFSAAAIKPIEVMRDPQVPGVFIVGQKGIGRSLTPVPPFIPIQE